MNAIQYDKSKKNCLLVFANKKVSYLDGITRIIESFSSCGYYFEKVSVVSYSNSTEIMSALTDGLRLHQNLVIVCPILMEKTVKDYFEASLKTKFDGLNTIKLPENNVFILLSDANCKLTINDVCAYFDSLYGMNYTRAYVRTVGVPVNLLDDALKDAKSCCSELEFNVTDSYGDCRIEIVYDNTVSKYDFDRAYRAVVARLNGYIYALDDFSLAERLVQLLKLRRLKISVAESFTGGGIGKRLVDIPGVSEVYFEGLNTYSNDAKISRLGVDEETLARRGAVSREVAAQMAEGLIKTGKCGVSIATTGIAGPKSDNTKKPVGLIYVALATADGTDVLEYNLKGSRESITETAINLALFAAYKRIK